MPWADSGVANIMYIVVQERTREIGIKRAVGARKRDILVQFFMETMFIIVLGSSVGFVIAYGITEALQQIPIREFVGAPEISVEVAIGDHGGACPDRLRWPGSCRPVVPQTSRSLTVCGPERVCPMWRELINDFLQDLNAQRTRAFLTILAMTWGTIAVVLLLSFGEGLGTQMLNGLINAGNQIMILYGGETGMQYRRRAERARDPAR